MFIYIYIYICMYVCMYFCQQVFSLLANWCLWSRVQILLSAEEHNLSPFDLNIACLCQSIEINNNKHVYRQSQVRKSTDSGAKCAECSLIIGTGCRVKVFSLILDSSVGLSASIQSAGELVSGVPGSNPAFSRGTQLVSFRFEYRCLCQSIEINNNKHECMYVCMYVCMHSIYIYTYRCLETSRFESCFKQRKTTCLL